MPQSNLNRRPHAQPARRSRSSPWGWVILGEGIVGVAIVAIAAFLLLYASNIILPGVHTMGVRLGGKSRTEAVAVLQQHWQQQAIILQAGKIARSAPPATLGITLDAQGTAQIAYRQGRSFKDWNTAISPVLKFDPLVARAGLQSLAAQLDTPPVNAGVRLVAGQVETTPAVPGQAVDVEATVAYLEQNAILVVTQGRLPVVMRPVSPAVTDASPVIEQARQLLVGTLLLYAYDPIANQFFNWAVAPDVWSEWLQLNVNPQAPAQLEWGMDAEKVRAFLAAQSAPLGAGRYLDTDKTVAAIMEAISARRTEARLRVYHYERKHTVQSGETLSSIGRAYGVPYAWVQQSNPGAGDELRVGQVLTIPSPDVLLPLPVVEHKRIVVSITEQKMWAYERGALRWEWPVSTGIASSYTSPGIFQIQTHERDAYAANWNLWMPYFMGIYRPVPTADFMNGFHGFPSRDGAQLLWTSNLGHPVTYGCILISTDNAAALYEWAEEGVVVEIQP